MVQALLLTRYLLSCKMLNKSHNSHIYAFVFVNLHLPCHCLFIYYYLRECAIRIVVDDIICQHDETEDAVASFLVVLCFPLNPISPTCQMQMIS